MVDATLVPGVTTDDAPQRKEAPPENAETIDCLIGIFTATRIESTPSFTDEYAEPPVIERKGFLIETDEKEDGVLKHNFQLSILHFTSPPVGRAGIFNLTIQKFNIQSKFEIRNSKLFFKWLLIRYNGNTIKKQTEKYPNSGRTRLAVEAGHSKSETTNNHRYKKRNNHRPHRPQAERPMLAHL